MCAWCGKTLRDGPSTNVSHGICPECSKKWSEADPELQVEGFRDWMFAAALAATLPGTFPQLGPATVHAQSGQLSPQTQQTQVVQQVINDATLAKARALLPASPTFPIYRVDPTKIPAGTPALRQKLNSDIGGLVFPGRPIVYMSINNRFYKEAASGDEFALHVLAAELAHEFVHCQGGGEKPAYAKQMQVMQGFIDSGDVDAAQGQKYMNQLKYWAASATPDYEMYR